MGVLLGSGPEINCRQEYDDDYEDEDMDTLYRNYEILSEFYGLERKR